MFKTDRDLLELNRWSLSIRADVISTSVGMDRDVQEEIQTIKKAPPSEEGGSGKDSV